MSEHLTSFSRVPEKTNKTSLSQACSEIITAASIRKGSMDNTTAMVIDLRGLWDEDRVGAKASSQRRCNTAAASSPDFKRNHHHHQQQQQQQLKALISSSNSPASSCLYGSGMGGGGGGNYCNSGGWDGGNTSDGKSTRARGDRHEQLRPSFSSVPWTLQVRTHRSYEKTTLSLMDISRHSTADYHKPRSKTYTLFCHSHLQHQ